MTKKTITAKEFDRLFDEGSDAIDPHIDWKNAKPAAHAARRVNVDFPAWMIHSLDKEAKHIGVARQALIKMWIAEKLETIHPSS